MKYFKAKVKGWDGKTHVIYGTSEPKWGQSKEGQAKHIALVRGYGKSSITRIKEFTTGENWYNAQYRKQKK